jgi:hypothetical protein
MINKQVQFEQPSTLLLFFNRFWIIITAVLVGALLLGGYYLIIQPKMNRNDILRESALQTSVDEDRSKQLLKNLVTLEGTYKEIITDRQADLDRLKEIVPNNPQIAELFVMSDRLAKQYGLQLQDINISDVAESVNVSAPSVSVNEDGESVSPVATSTPKTNNIVFLKVLKIDFKVSPITAKDALTIEAANGVAVTNYYQTFKNFLDVLEKNLRLTDIQTVNFSSLQEDSLSVPTFQFSVQTYYR